MRWACLALLPILAGCADPDRPAPDNAGTPGPITLLPVPPDQHIPDYAKRPFEPFSRANAVAIAQREWRMFGSPVNDAPPGPDMPRSDRPDRQPGLWQRVGDYWWHSQDAGTRQGGWTSRYDEYGREYGGIGPAWSAAFVSYVMRTAGAGTRFAYAPLHAEYINAAARGEGVVRAERPDAYAPQEGDLICTGRASSRGIRFEDLPAPSFYGHCDIVVSRGIGQVQVVGGNVSAGVTLKNIPTTAPGTLADSGGRVVDERYDWFVVLRVLYDE